MKCGKISMILALSLCLLTACRAGTEPAAPQETEAETDKARAAFTAALDRLETEGVYPDGSTSADKGVDDFYAQDHYEDKYAILDVDGDGKEELLLCHGDDCMAGMFTAVYGFDPETETLREELVEWPGLTLYDNGYIRAESSHNQTSGNLWPYMLWRYDETADKYVQQYVVHSTADGSPEENAGERYFVNPASEDGWNEEKPMDEAEYLAWEQSWMEGGEEIRPEWQSVSVPGADLSQAAG